MSDIKFRKVGKNGIEISETLGIGSYGRVYKGRYKDEDVAVKRLLMGVKHFDSELENLRKVDHVNVIRYIFSDHDDDFLYIVLEICEFSLQDYVQERKDISLSKVEILEQITDGLNYLHNEKDDCNVHRDLKPSNILFVRSGNSWKVKICDFGISKYIPSNQTSVTGTSQQGSRGYMAPEELKDGEMRIRKESDIFSLGIVFYYLLSNGKHPYGKDHLKWDSKIRDGDPPELTSIEPIYVEDATSLITSMLHHDFRKRIKIEQVKAHHLFWDAERKLTFLEDQQKLKKVGDEQVVEMVTKEFAGGSQSGLQDQPSWSWPRGHKWKTVGKAQVIKIVTKEFARGSQSTIHRGRYDDKDVAVKRLLTSGKQFDSKELENLRKLKHYNVIEYKFSDHDDEFLYIVLEKCEFSLRTYIKRREEISISKVEVLRQMTDGLNYLHNENIVHRDLKPTNILFLRNGNSWKVKISDFGISKYIPSDQTSVTRTSSGGSKGYMAPEVLKEGEKIIGKESDIFSLGIVFYYLLSNGKHPYGKDDLKWDSNILNGEPPGLTGMEAIYIEDAISLITSMLVHDFGKRIKIEQVKAHHLFWDAKRKVTFFQEVSDYLEDRAKHQKLINKLEQENIKKGVAVNWREKLENESDIMRTTIGKLGKNRTSLQDLIRLVRNLSHHYHDTKTPDEILNEIGGVPGGLVKYFTSRFPKLLPFVYDMMKSENAPHLKEFYSVVF